MREWIEVIASLVTACAAVIAVWRYFFALDLPINLTVPNTFFGETSTDGRQTGASVSYNYRLLNFGPKDIQIAKIVLRKRSFFGLDWLFAHRREIAADQMPNRLPPDGVMDIWVTIEQKAVGAYRLIVQEYGSRRFAKFALSELQQTSRISQS